MTDDQASLILLTLKAALPYADQSLDPLRAASRDGIYRKTLLSWTMSSALEAVESCLLTSRYYPTLAELHAAYGEARRSRPELSRAPALPPKGGTLASPVEVRAACEAAISRVTANVVPESPKRRATARPERHVTEESLIAQVRGLPAPEGGS